ncbi:MAG: hypothetical protein FJ148_16885 [Deltaproteobacteria bacterium]|nr:hypothetical protein [Deltaproteobacteria bacterium]
MSHQPGSWKIRLLLLVAAVVSACGGGDICLQCPDGTPTPPLGVIVTGTIVSSNPSTNPSSIMAIVCVGLEQGQSVSNCPNSFYADVATDGTFTRKNVKEGAETIFFWVDNNMNEMPDQEGDLIAQLQDGTGELDRVENGQTVTLSDIRIAFLNNSATATITVGLTPTPTPSPVTVTPTPKNT